MHYISYAHSSWAVSHTKSGSIPLRVPHCPYFDDDPQHCRQHCRQPCDMFDMGASCHLLVVRHLHRWRWWSLFGAIHRSTTEVGQRSHEDKTICTTLSNMIIQPLPFLLLRQNSEHFLSLWGSKCSLHLHSSIHPFLIHHGLFYLETGHLVGTSIALCCFDCRTCNRVCTSETRGSMEKDGTL